MKVLKASADDAMRELLEREMVIGRLLYEALGKIDDQGPPPTSPKTSLHLWKV